MDGKEKTPENAAFIRLAGTCSLIQSFLYVVAVIALSQTPLLGLLGREGVSGMELFIANHSANPWPIILMCLSFILLGLLGFAAVAPATACFFRDQDDGWLTAGKHLGMLCLAVITVYYTWFLVTLPSKAALWTLSDEAARPLLAAVLNPQEPSRWMSWFLFGGMGLWVAAVGATAFRHPTLGRGFPLVCAIKTAGFWLAHAGIIFQAAPLAVAGAVVGGLIGGPAYHAWLGKAMRNFMKPAAQATRRPLP